MTCFGRRWQPELKRRTWECSGGWGVSWGGGCWGGNFDGFCKRPRITTKVRRGGRQALVDGCVAPLKVKRDRLKGLLDRIHAEYRGLVLVRASILSALQEQAKTLPVMAKMLESKSVPSTQQLKELLGAKGEAELEAGILMLKEMRFQGIHRRLDLAVALVGAMAHRHEAHVTEVGEEEAAQRTMKLALLVMEPAQLSPVSREILQQVREEVQGGTEAMLVDTMVELCGGK